MKMKVAELKEELDLEAREEEKTGNKVWPRRNLHAAIVRDHLRRRATRGGGVTLVLPRGLHPTGEAKLLPI